MQADSVAGRYARALLDIAIDKNEIEAYGEHVQTFVEVFEMSDDLRVVLTNPGIPMRERQAVVVAVLDLLAFDKMVCNFVRLLVERGRIGQVADVGAAYQTLADKRAGRVRGTAKSAVAMSVPQLTKLTAAISRLTKSEVVLESTLDESLLGGVRVEIGGQVFDGSVRGELDRLREQLTS